MNFDHVIQEFDDGSELTVGDFLLSCLVGAAFGASVCMAIEARHRWKIRRYNKMYDKKYQYYPTK